MHPVPHRLSAGAHCLVAILAGAFHRFGQTTCVASLSSLFAMFLDVVFFSHLIFPSWTLCQIATCSRAVPSPLPLLLSLRETVTGLTTSRCQGSARGRAKNTSASTRRDGAAVSENR